MPMDIILTGIARSGTTLSCAMLNELPQVVALAEPMRPDEIVALGYPDDYLMGLSRYFRKQRASLLLAGTAFSKARHGKVPENSFAQSTNQAGLRTSICEYMEIRFDKVLHKDFQLVIKHPNAFTATLPILVTRYPCFAIIRNPLAVLLSWQTIDASVNRGRIPMGEVFDSNLREALEAESDCLSRQLIILRWYFSRYASLIPEEHVIRYEDLVASGGQALSVITPAAKQIRKIITNKNKNSLYGLDLVSYLSDRLLADESVYSAFYTREAIEELRDEWLWTSHGA